MEAKDNVLLSESVACVREKLGSRLENMTVERAVFGLFFSGVKLSTGHGGLCFTPVKDMPEAVCCPSSARAMPLSGRLKNRPVEKYLEDVFSDNSLKRTLGIATLNALSMYIWGEEPAKEYETIWGADAFDELDVSKYEKTVVIGALVPMLKRLIRENRDFKVLEQDARTLKGEELNHFVPSERMAEIVPQGDLLVITGVTILNHTLPDILACAKEGAEILITGPTASMLPDAFFKRGVTMLGGIQVTKPDELLDIIAEGGSGYHFFGKYAERSVIRIKRGGDRDVH
ncbi:MAG: DUF364 domain-containing protein [Lachnospiraceae bacterium]|nr:DUF364 domain-containing protein [Lachnospiraceae bacterium]